MKRLGIVRLAAGAAALVLAGVSGASAQGEGVAVKSILGAIGIIPKDRPRIDYRERAPLVLPPKMELRAPAESSAVETRAGNWPKDPDVAAARKDAAEARKPVTQREAYKNDEAKPLSIDEMRAGRRAGASPGEFQSLSAQRKAESGRLTPDEMRSFSKNEEAQLDPTQLKRRYLSDPPQDLLKAAGNAPLKATAEPPPSLIDPDSPVAFQRQQASQFSR